MPIILAPVMFLVSNFLEAANVSCWVTIVADVAFLVFFKRKYVGLVPCIWYTETIVGSSELEAEKSITSSIIKV